MTTTSSFGNAPSDRERLRSATDHGAGVPPTKPSDRERLRSATDREERETAPGVLNCKPDQRSATTSDRPFLVALTEMLMALPALPEWPPGTVQAARRKAIAAYEKAKTP
jgi:hypothetical protein